MNKKQGLSILVVGLLLTGLAIAAGNQAPTEPKTIEVIGGKQGPVKFSHTGHANVKKADGSVVVCKTCHHTLKTDVPAETETVGGCPSCHVKEGEAQKDFEGKKVPFLAKMNGDKADMKSVIFHKNCLEGCHKLVKVEGKNLTACKTCHAK